MSAVTRIVRSENLPPAAGLLYVEDQRTGEWLYIVAAEDVDERYAEAASACIARVRADVFFRPSPYPEDRQAVS